MIVPKDAVNFTTSIGVKASPGLPPMVPLIPEIDLISVMCSYFDGKSMEKDFGNHLPLSNFYFILSK